MPFFRALTRKIKTCIIYISNFAHRLFALSFASFETTALQIARIQGAFGFVFVAFHIKNRRRYYMKKKLLLCLIVILAVCCCFLCACSLWGNDTTTTAEVTFKDKTVTYNGEKHEPEIKLPDGVTATYTIKKDGAPFTGDMIDAGVYTVTAKFAVPSGATPIADRTATLTINRAKDQIGADVSVSDVTLPCNGAYQRFPDAAISGLPEGVVAIMNGTPVRNAGESSRWTISFAYSDPVKAANREIVGTKEALLQIEKGTLDMSDVKFEDKTVPYNGSAVTITVTGTLPKGVSVSYTANTLNKVGRTEATAKFKLSDELARNYKAIEPMKAVLTIEKGTVDMTGVTFDGLSADWVEGGRAIVVNGYNHLKAIEGIVYTISKPDGSDPKPGNRATEPGEWKVTAHFQVNTELWNQPADMTATISLRALVDLSGVYWGYTTGDAELPYLGAIQHDGTAKTVKLLGLPAGVTATYSGITTATDAGTYTAEATLSSSSEDAALPESSKKWKLTWEISANVVDPEIAAGLRFADASFPYDGNAHRIFLADSTGTEVTAITGVKEIRYSVVDSLQEICDYTKLINGGVYTITVSFEMEEGYGQLAAKQAKLTIEKINLALSTLFVDKEFVYNTLEQKIDAPEGPLPEGVRVVYTNNARTNVGEQTVTITFQLTGDARKNYNTPPEITRILKITPKEISAGTIAWNYKAPFTYTGGIYTIELTGLDANLSVTYSGTYSAKNAGTYTANATITCSDQNYLFNGGEEYVVTPCEWTIKKAIIDKTQIKWDYTGPFFTNGEEVKTVSIIGCPDTLEFTKEGTWSATAEGQYKAIAKFTCKDPANYECEAFNMELSWAIVSENWSGIIVPKV